LRRVQRRLLLFQGSERAARALFAATVAACAWLIITRLFPQLGGAIWVALALGVGALLGAVLWTWRKPPRLIDAALAADARLGLKERFISSLALHEAGESYCGGSEEMAAALHADATQCLARLDHRRDFPFVPSRAMRWLALPIALFGVAYVLFPEVDLLGHQAREAQARVEQAEREKKAAMLENAARVLPKAPEQEAAQVDAITRDLHEIAAALQEGRITEKQALARVNSLADQLRAERDALANKAATPMPPLSPRDMGLAKDAVEAMQRGRPADAAKALRALQDKLKEGGLSEAEKMKLAEALKKIAESMGNASAQQLANGLPKPGTQAMTGAELEMALETMELSLCDMASALEQMAQLEVALQQMTEWQRQQGGEKSLFGKCKSCGKMLKPGQCAGGQCNSCNGSRPGNTPGTGNEMEELPADDMVEFAPGMLPGNLREGKMLADMMQRTAPEAAGEEATIASSGPVLIRVRQEAEQALTKEEVPPGAREFVRQYFGAIDSGE
jgi:hypothetical protein